MKTTSAKAKTWLKSKPNKSIVLLKDLKNWQAKTQAPIPSELNPDFDAEKEKAAIEKKLNSANQKGNRKRGKRQKQSSKSEKQNS